MPMSFPYVSRNTLQFNADVNVKKCVVRFLNFSLSQFSFPPDYPLNLCHCDGTQGWKAEDKNIVRRGNSSKGKNPWSKSNKFT